MEVIGFTDAEQANALLDEMMSGADGFIGGEFWKILDDDLLDVGRTLERLNRKLFAAQVHLAGEIDSRGMAATRSCSSTAALLRQALVISPGDAAARVRLARQVLPQDLPSGAEAPPVLPAVAAALDAGAIGTEHARTILATMKDLPSLLDVDARAICETTLVEHAYISDPRQFDKIAAHLLTVIDPDGTLDDRAPSSRMEFSIGIRNPGTGLTPISGRLDDLSVEALRKVIEPLAAPKPEVGGVKDTRSAPNRRAFALAEALTFVLSHGGTPEQGGERPQVTVTLDWDLMNEAAHAAVLESGGSLTAGDTRKVLCDAKVIPAILNGASEVLDVGRASRTFPRGIRRAITLRDKGCAWHNCDRPPGWCAVHHVDWWVRDLGETSYRRGVMLCEYHHVEIHRGEWTLRMAEDGTPEVIPPRWIDPDRKPRRNTLHHLPLLFEHLTPLTEPPAGTEL